MSQLQTTDPVSTSTTAPTTTTKTAPPIKNLVFKGGGPKGLVYAGSVKFLEEQGILDGVERVAGASAGAIMAAMLAIGYDADELLALLGTDFKSFLDDDTLVGVLDQEYWQTGEYEDPATYYKLDDYSNPEHYYVAKSTDGWASWAGKKVFNFGSSVVQTGKTVGKGGYNVGATMVTWNTEALKNKGNLGLKLNGLRKAYGKVTTDGYFCTGDAVERWIRGKIDEKITAVVEEHGDKIDTYNDGKPVEEKINANRIKRSITFAMLHKLKEAGVPGIRDVYMVLNKVTGQQSEEVVFSHENPQTADVAIADAVRGSMSIPVIFKAKQIGGASYMDGGMQSNFPVRIFDRKKFVSTPTSWVLDNCDHGDPPYNAETICLFVDTKQSIDYLRDDIDDAPSELPSGLVSILGKEGAETFGDVLKTYLGHEQARKNFILQDRQRTCFIDCLGVGLLDFGISEDKKKELVKSGQRSIKDYLRTARLKTAGPGRTYQDVLAGLGEADRAIVTEHVGDLQVWLGIVMGYCAELEKRLEAAKISTYDFNNITDELLDGLDLYEDIDESESPMDSVD